MYVRDGIAYAGAPEPQLRVKSVRPASDYRLFIRFSNDEERVFDVKPLLNTPAFAPLKDKALFERVYINYGTILWPGGIDYCPDCLYAKSEPAEKEL